MKRLFPHPFCTDLPMPTANSGWDDRFTLIRYGPTLRVRIGFDPDHNLRQDEGNPDIGNELYPALVDTGALGNCIDSSLARDMGLPEVNQWEVAGIAGVFKASVYLAQVHIPDLGYWIYGRFAGVNLSEGRQVHRALLGRRFLRLLP